MATSSSILSYHVNSAVLTEREIPQLLAKLYSLLPYPIPLYRRLQFHLKHPNPASARGFLAIASDSDAPNTTTPQRWLSTPSSSPDLPFLAAHIDLSCSGETQIFLFASWEVPLSHLPNSFAAPPPESTRCALLDSLFITLAKDPFFIPSRPTTQPESHRLLTATKKVVTPYSPSKVLIGAMNSELLDFIPRHSHARSDAGFVKYLFTPPPPSPPSVTNEIDKDDKTNPPLPPGYRFGTIADSDAHLNLVLSRTVIPRTLATLRSLGSVGIFYNADADPNPLPPQPPAADQDDDPATSLIRGSDTRTAREIELSAHTVPSDVVAQKLEDIQRQPVAWGFLGKDASLTSLHVERIHRGKGLAGAVTAKLWDMLSEVFNGGIEREGEEGEEGRGKETGLGHADVFEGNTASRRVMEKLGGKSSWVVVWVEVDVAAVVK